MSSRVLLLVIAAIIAAFTAVSVRNRLAKAPVQQEAQVQPVTQRVAVAKKDLAPGSFVQSADLAWGEAPTGISPESGMYLREGMVSLTDFNGAVVRRQLRTGEPVPAQALMKSGEGGFMSAVLDPGKRAVSISVNATSGNAGFVSPGDRIDLIVTHRVKLYGNENSQDETVVSETFVQDVRVVAVDQMLDNPDNKAILAKTVTMEVSPRQAEQISVAAEMGKISVALRSLSAQEPRETAQNESGDARIITDLYGNTSISDGTLSNAYTRDSDVSPIRSTIVPRVQVIRGDKSENLEFYQDGKP